MMVGVQQQSLNFNVGDYCEVMGKIKAMTAGEKSSFHRMESLSAELDVRFGCIREVHASSVCSMRQYSNGEIVHWLKCMQFSRDVSQNKIKNGKDTLHFLSKSIVTSIVSTEMTDLDLKSRNIHERKCCQSPQRFRQALLYCHCDATLVNLDPSFHYRNAVLNCLLDMESKLHHTSHCEYAPYTEDCVDLIGKESNSSPPLLFTFETIYKDEYLSSVANELVASTAVPDANARQLIQNTFRAMTNDGLLSLYDSAADLYLLLSVERVIGPYLQQSSGALIAPPFFIRNVPKKRMNQLKCWLTNT
jgi:hypothetical protein